MIAVSSLDDRTKDAIRRATALAGAGRLSVACDICEAALRDGGETLALNALLGMLRCRAGDFKGAIQNLRMAHDMRPSDLSIATNLVLALVECGELEEALAIASPARVAADASLQLARYRGYIAQLIGKSEVAVEAYSAIVSAKPDDWQSWNNLGTAQLIRGNNSGSIAAFHRSLEIRDDQPPTWLNLANALVKDAQLDAAERQLRLTSERFPNEVRPLKELYDLMQRRDRPDSMLHAVLEQALLRDSRDKGVLLAIGQHRMLAGNMQSAETAFRMVLNANSGDSEAYLELARLYEHTAPDRLETLAVEARRARLSPPTANLVEAFAHRRSKRFADGIATLERVPSDFEPSLTNELRGQFYEKLNKPEAAFAAFREMNEAQAADGSNPMTKAARIRASLSNRIEHFTTEWLESWNPASDPAPNERPSPVFLVGFPRSGTTLLDTMLMGHDEVAVMEEAPALDSVSRQIGGFERIPILCSGKIREARTLYFDVASKYADIGRRLLIDKNPLHMTHVAMIHRLFPDARFLLAIRHPADVILSCYFSNFRRTPILANFLRLDTSAEYFNLVWCMWMRGRELINLNVTEVKYERLVVDPETELRTLTNALNVDWREELLDHRRTAASRTIIRSASYAQVTEPLYSSSINRWERYRQHLAPILPALRPWIEKFGYSL